MAAVWAAGGGSGAEEALWDGLGVGDESDWETLVATERSPVSALAVGPAESFGKV